MNVLVINYYYNNYKNNNYNNLFYIIIIIYLAECSVICDGCYSGSSCKGCAANNSLADCSCPENSYLNLYANPITCSGI